jgi:hypothetical protein
MDCFTSLSGLVKFQLLTVMCMKMAIFWDVALSSLVDIVLMMEPVSIFEIIVYKITWHDMRFSSVSRFRCVHVFSCISEKAC